MSLFQQLHSDILVSINKYLNPVDRNFLSCVCLKFRSYFTGQCKPSIGQLVQCGYLDLLIQYNKHPYNEYINKARMVRAVIYGHLEIMKYLLNIGFSKVNNSNRAINLLCDEWTCQIAASYGRLDILQWLRTENCLWDGYTCSEAAYNGHLTVFKWAVENGCSWNPEKCIKRAKSKGHQNIVDWIIIQPLYKRWCSFE